MFRLDAGGEVRGQVDVDMFQRVLLNLLSNAFKFTPRQGSRVLLHPRPRADMMQRPIRLVEYGDRLPRVGGLEVLRMIRSDERTRHLPVVALTSSDEDGDWLADYDGFVAARRKLGLYWTTVNFPPPRGPA